MRGEVEERVLRALAAESLTKIGYLRQLVGRMKIRAAVAYLVTAVDNGVPVLAFGWYQQVVKGVVAGLKKNGVRVGLVDGGMSSEEKQKVNDAFEAGQLDVVVGSKALAVGASYPRAQEVLFIERFWTPADEMQAEDRAHRATTKHPVVVSFLHLNGTVDERVRAIVDRKRHLVSAVLGGADVSFDATGVREVLSDYLGTRPFEPEEDTPTRVAPVAPSKPSVSKADVVALSFARKDWTPRNAVEWAKISGWRPDRIREVRGRLILDVGKAKRGVAYRAVKLGSGVTAIVPRR
jgi:hypothetical protein